MMPAQCYLEADSESVLVCSLLLCSDIHLNPGPPCQVCGKAVKSNQDGIEFSNWNHRTCDNVSKKEYMRLSGCDDPWYCHTCVIPFFSDSFFDDTSSNSGMHQTENRSSHGEAVDHSDECEQLAQQYPKNLGVIHYNLPNSINLMNSESPIETDLSN